MAMLHPRFRAGALTALLGALLVTPTAIVASSPLGDREAAMRWLERNGFAIDGDPSGGDLVGARPGLEVRHRFDGPDLVRTEIHASAQAIADPAERERYVDWPRAYAADGEDFRQAVFNDAVARMGSMGGTDVGRQTVLRDRVYGIDIRWEDTAWTLWVVRRPAAPELLSSTVPEAPCPTEGPRHATGTMELVVDSAAEVRAPAGSGPTRVWIVDLLPFQPWGEPPQLRSASWAETPRVLRPDDQALIIEGPVLRVGVIEQLRWTIAYPTDSFMRHEARIVALPESGPGALETSMEQIPRCVRLRLVRACRVGERALRLTVRSTPPQAGRATTATPSAVLRDTPRGR